MVMELEYDRSLYGKEHLAGPFEVNDRRFHVDIAERYLIHVPGYPDTECGGIQSPGQPLHFGADGGHLQPIELQLQVPLGHLENSGKLAAQPDFRLVHPTVQNYFVVQLTAYFRGDLRHTARVQANQIGDGAFDVKGNVKRLKWDGGAKQYRLLPKQE